MCAIIQWHTPVSYQERERLGNSMASASVHREGEDLKVVFWPDCTGLPPSCYLVDYTNDGQRALEMAREASRKEDTERDWVYVAWSEQTRALAVFTNGERWERGGIPVTHNGTKMPCMYVRTGIGVEIAASGLIVLDARAVTCSQCGGLVFSDSFEDYGTDPSECLDPTFTPLCRACLAQEG